MKKYTTVILATVAMTVSMHGRIFIPADDPAILFTGRTICIEEGARMFNYPGVSARLNFTGTNLQMSTSPGSGYFVVEIDSLPPRKIFYSSNDSILTIAGNLPDTAHQARITYAQEGFEFHPVIKGFMIDDERTLLDPPAKQKLKIEFIGNSITCGYGTEGADGEEHFSYDTENHCLSYAYLTARALDADANIVARSGIGVYRNFGGPKDGSPEGTMPQEYDNTMIYDKSVPWDFSSFRPDIICINLGTNDLSSSNYDINIFECAYKKFLDHVREKNPDSKIVLLTGSMLNGDDLAVIKDVLDRIAANRKNVFRFDMSPQTGDLGYGSDFHPSAAQSRKMAEELTSFLKTKLYE